MRWSLLFYPKFHLLRHVTKRACVSRLSCVSRRVCSNMADDKEAVVLACTSLVFCALDLHEAQGQLLEKVSHPSPRCACDAPQHVSCKSHLSWRACRAVLSDKRVTARHDFFSCQNAWAIIACRAVSWRDAPSGIWTFLRALSAVF